MMDENRSIKLYDIIHCLNQWAPLALQESYDNAGLITGDTSKDIKKALISLDITDAVLDEAISLGASLIIAHHPLVFSGIKRLTGKTYVERLLIKAIKKDIAIFCMHTNLDNVDTGVNMQIARKIGLDKLRILSPKPNTLSKLVIFCPRSHIKEVKRAMFNAGAGRMGQYEQTSFETLGTGTFTPTSFAHPFIGKKDVAQRVEEIKIETIAPHYKIHHIIEQVKKVHPYEEMAFDVLPLIKEHTEVGSGVIGVLSKPVDTITFLSLLKNTFECVCIRHTELVRKEIKKVALCGGSGSSLLSIAIAQGADIFVSADFKYHQFFDADKKIVIADIGHYESEQFTKHLISDYLRENFPTFEAVLSSVNTNPINYLV